MTAAEAEGDEWARDEGGGKVEEKSAQEEKDVKERNRKNEEDEEGKCVNNEENMKTEEKNMKSGRGEK